VAVGVVESVSVGVRVGVAVDPPVSVTVPDGVGGGTQPNNAALTAATSSSIVTVELKLRSAAGQIDKGSSPSAMRTARTSSSMVTTLPPSQSPGQAVTKPGGCSVVVATVPPGKRRRNIDRTSRCR
jgi:hypothetical protein